MPEPDPPLPRKFRWPDIVALAIYLTCLLLYFWPLILAKSALFYFDVTELNYAYRHFFAENLKKGVISFWCNNLYNGFPLYSESQAGYWHPLKYLFYPFLSTWAAFGYDMVGSLALAGVGTYLWLRRHSEAPGALAGALIVTFGGFTWAHFVHTSMINALASVPWIIWGLERSWNTGRLTGAGITGIALACQVFAGHLQDAVFSIQLISLLTIYQLISCKDWKTRKWFIACGGFAMILGVLIAAVQWLPSYELLKRTPRTEGLSWKDQTFGSWHPQLLPTLFVREAYGTRARDTDWMDGFYPYHEMNSYLGLSAMLLALLGARRWREPWVGMWIFIGFVSAIFMLGRFTFVMDFWHRVPVLGSSRIPVRYHLWATLATAALVSQGLSQLTMEPQKVRLRKSLAVLVLAGLIAFAIFVWTMIPWWTETGRWTTAYHRERNQWLSRELLFSTGRSALLFVFSLSLIKRAMHFKENTYRIAAGFLLASLIGMDLIGSHWHEMPTVDPSYWTLQPTSVSVIKQDPNASRVMGVARYSAGEPGYASSEIDFFRTRDALGWSLPLAYGLESNIGETPFRPARLIRLTDLAGGEAWRFSIEGVSHLVTGQRLNSIVPPIASGTAFIYRLPEPEPRYHWAKTVRLVSDDKAAEQMMKDLGAENTGNSLVLEAPESELLKQAKSAADINAGIELINQGPDQIRLNLSTPEPRILRLGISFDPGWKAYIDGKPVPIYPAQLAFMGVFVPAGDHAITLRYWPANFNLGLALSVTGAIFGILSVIFVRVKENRISTGNEESAWWLNPAWLGLALAILLLLSAFGTDSKGAAGLSSRWDDSWHRFTWGAGIEAIGR